jgi:hypothetical protein
VGAAGAAAARIREWIERDRLRLTNIHGKPARRGVEVPYRTVFKVEFVNLPRPHRDGLSSRSTLGRSISVTTAADIRVDEGIGRGR